VIHTLPPVEANQRQRQGAVLIDIRKASLFRRNYPLVDDMAQVAGIPPEQMDALWAWAAQIE